MKVLSLETSTKTFSLAVSDRDKILRRRSVRLKKVLSSSIMPGIEEILKTAGLSLDEIEGFAVGLGPGSFTSLRVGLSTVKALAFAKKKLIVGIPSLDILAMNVKEDGPICTLCDAKRNMVYACFFEKDGGRLKRKSKYMLSPIGEVFGKIKKDTFFIGDGIPLFCEEIVRSSKNKWKPFFYKESLWAPLASELAGLAYERFRNKEFDNIDRLVPLYLYPEDCQVRRMTS